MKDVYHADEHTLKKKWRKHKKDGMIFQVHGLENECPHTETSTKTQCVINSSYKWHLHRAREIGPRIYKETKWTTNRQSNI